MRGLTKAAALLLAPALASASLLDLEGTKSDSIPLAIVDFDVPQGNGVESLALNIDVKETDDICGETDLSINGKQLTFDEHGAGSGKLPIDGKKVKAHWLLSCVMSHNEPEAQLLRFAVDEVNGRRIKSSELLLTFRKTAPALVLDFHGANDKAQKGKGKDHPEEDLVMDEELQAEIQELEALHAQAHELMKRIHEKEMAIHERFGERGPHHRRPPPPPPGFSELRNCDSIQCVVRTITERVRHTAGSLYGGFFDDGHGWDDMRPHHGDDMRHGDDRHHKFPGNHSRPFPPHERPPFCPPCHGPPPPPHHGEHPPPPPPYDEFPPPPEDGELPPPPPPGHGDRPHHPPSKGPEDGDHEFPPSRHHGEHPPASGHGDHSAPPPPHGKNGPHHGQHDEDRFPPMESKDGKQHPHHPPGPFHHGGPPGPPGHHGHHHHGPPPHHNPVVMTLGMAAIALAIFSIIGLAYIHRRIARLTPESRRAIRRAIRRSDSERHSRDGRPSGIRGAVQRVLGRWAGEYDEEKEAMLGRRRSDSEDSVTMEQEIARFREAAFMVEGLVNAEESRNAQRDMAAQRMHPYPHPHYYHHAPPPPPPHHPHHYPHPHPHGPPPPPPPPRPPMIPNQPPQAVYPEIVASERLPSYENDTADSSVVSDGCRYTPGSSDYAPSETASNNIDILGDSKN